MSEPAVRLVAQPTEEIETARFDAITRLCEAAFGEPFAPVWDRVGPGLHVIGLEGGRVVGHAMIVDRALYPGREADASIDVGYVENVATDPARQGSGVGTAVMTEIGRLIAAEYSLGALGTGSNAFYARLGWEAWRGPTWVRMPDGERLRTPGADGHVMVLRTDRTPASLDPAAPIGVDWRPGDSW